MPPLVALPARAPGTATPGVALRVRAGSPTEQPLKLSHRVRQQGWVPASLDGEAHRSIQRRHLVRAETPSLTLPKPDSGDSLSADDLVVDRHRVTPDLQHCGQRVEPGAGLDV